MRMSQARGRRRSSRHPPGTAWAKSPRTPSPSKKKVLRYLKILILLFAGFILVFLSLFGVSSLAPFFEAHVLLILEPLGVDFELLTLKNLDFMKAGARFSKNQGLWSKDALDGVLSSLGLVLGALGGFLGDLLVPLRALGGTLNFQNFFWGLP